MKQTMPLTSAFILLVAYVSVVYASPASGGNSTPPVQELDAPTGTLGVSASALGPYTNDRAEDIVSPMDDRIVNVSPGGIFYAQVAYEDPDGIAAVSLDLVNSSPSELAGSLNPERAGFEIVDASAENCDLAGTSTTVSCLFTVRVAEDAVNIDQLQGAGDEFAYVFRTHVTDSLGNESNEAIRGYVIVAGAGDAGLPAIPSSRGSR